MDSENAASRPMHKKLCESLRGLAGLPCWSVVAGRGTGSIVALDFGEKIQRPRRLKNPKLTEEQRTHWGEYQLMVCCAWRLDSGDCVICGSGDPNEEGGAMLEGLQRVVGRSVTSVRVMEPGLDLTVDFEPNLQLKIFCDETEVGSDSDNYVIRDRRNLYGVGPRGEVSFEAVEES